MSEIQKTTNTTTSEQYQIPVSPEETQEKGFDPSEGNPFVGRQHSDSPISEEAEAARRHFIQVTDRPSEDLVTVHRGESTPAPWSRGKKVAATLAASTALVGGGLVTLDNTLPREEIATVTTTVEQGGDITSAVDEALDEIKSLNVDPADPTERLDVISQAVDLNSDENGIVQPGETVTVTATSTPIFGDTRYQAVPDPMPSEAPVSEANTIPSPEQK